METFSALLALCVGNSLVTGEFPSQRPVVWSFDVIVDLRLNKRLSKQSWGWWFQTPSRPLWCRCNAKITLFLTHWSYYSLALSHRFCVKISWLCHDRVNIITALSFQCKFFTDHYLLLVWWGIHASNWSDNDWLTFWSQDTIGTKADDSYQQPQYSIRFHSLASLVSHWWKISNDHQGWL